MSSPRVLLEMQGRGGGTVPGLLAPEHRYRADNEEDADEAFR